MTVKKLSTLAAVALPLLLFSCASIKGTLKSPSIDLESVSIDGIDMEGITFKCRYCISNPYPVSFSIKEVSADVIQGENTFTRLSTSNGVKVAAGSSSENALLVKLPYDAILQFATAAKGETSLPFTIKGTALIDLSALPYLNGKNASLPFSKEFQVPVFKPHILLSDVKIQMPSFQELFNSFKQGGFDAAKASNIAAAVISKKGITEALFKGIDLNFGLSFSVKATNEGSAPWKYAINNCTFKTKEGGTLAEIKVDGENDISSSNAIIPMTANLNTLEAGAFIVRLLTKTGENPVFSLDSALTFTDLQYAPNLPLSYTHEFLLSSVN